MIYFDNAATTFEKPPSVYKTVYDAMVKYGANAGRGGHDLSVKAGDMIYEAREAVCRLFRIQNIERLVFCQNTTQALNTGMKGVLKKGDHVVISCMEHNSVLRPVAELQKRGIITYSVVKGNEKGEIPLSAVRMAIRPNTKLVVFTHASNVCGNVYDIKAIAKLAHDNGALFMADAAQSAGILDVDANDVDLLAFPGHKGLMGPQGTGGLYIREGLNLNTIMEGGTGSASELIYQPDIMPDRFESGTQNMPAIAGLGEGAKFILKEGVDAIRAHEMDLTKYFLDEIQNIPKITIYGTKNLSGRVGVVALNIDGEDCVDVANELNTLYGIATRGGLHCSALAHETLGTLEKGCVRFSFGYFNKRKEVDKAVLALLKIANREQFYQFYAQGTMYPRI